MLTGFYKTLFILYFLVPSPAKSEEGDYQIAAKTPTKDIVDPAAIPIKKEIIEETKAEFPVESKKKLASKERRAKAMALMEENANAMLDAKVVHQVLPPPSVAQKQHIRKAKLLNHVVHVETLMQRNNSQDPLATVSGVGFSDSQVVNSKPSEMDKSITSGLNVAINHRSVETDTKSPSYELCV